VVKLICSTARTFAFHQEKWKRLRLIAGNSQHAAKLLISNYNIAVVVVELIPSSHVRLIAAEHSEYLDNMFSVVAICLSQTNNPTYTVEGISLSLSGSWCGIQSR
jgi:hypothetical protein